MHIINVKELHYSYEKTEVFHNNTLNLKVSQNQKNKLYGIIGPSGTGKTTLLSILGGQLKPQQGAGIYR
jgi:ABC-type transporter Mla maintaining outer membrane lipid asymmetry ATPase subunit MlaF